MKNCVLLAVLVLISKFDGVMSDKYDEEGLTRELVSLLNGTYFSLNEKVCQLQRRVDVIEGTTDSGNQCECNNTEILEFKRSISNELGDFSKVLSGFENDIRLLKKQQVELRELLDGGDSRATTTAASTTSTPAPECKDGWILSPEGNCYYVSTSSEKTEWATAIDRCTAMGAKLVEFRTDEEAQFVMSNLPSRVATSDIIYTGRKRNLAGEWVFLSNNQRVDTSVRSWGSGEPDGGKQTCGCTRKSDDFLMLDCLCPGFYLYYICETSLSDITTTPIISTTTPIISTPVCDDGWILSPERKCYYVSSSSEKTDWATAIDRCTDIGAKLVEFRTDEEAKFVMHNLPARVSTSDIIYTGRKRTNADEWVFLSDNERVYTSVRSWGVGEPDGGEQRCGCTRKSDNFLMLDCLCPGFNLYYICETSPTMPSVTTTTISPPRDCDDGWISSQEKCYYVSTDAEQTEWATSVSRCNDKGANLVEIKSDEEARFIMNNLPSRIASTDLIYTGRKRNDAKGWVFLSNDETVDTSVRSWASDEPDGGSQRCGCTRKSDLFQMHDCVCTGYDLYYVCEITR